jgi:hypothetical protein
VTQSLEAGGEVATTAGVVSEAEHTAEQRQDGEEQDVEEGGEGVVGPVRASGGPTVQASTQARRLMGKNSRIWFGSGSRFLNFIHPRSRMVPVSNNKRGGGETL